MKDKIHPNYAPVKARCACGFEFETRSTAKEIVATICSQCHPYFSGKQKFVDTAGRIEKFQKRFAAAEGVAGSNPYTRKKAAAPKKAAEKV
ncbi:MAG: 50S ribosomal protein L31 [Planctomycetota bacterium]|jgi:large subunit ribosomal protein L31|nr:50S ribosomal protein L31 [Planctomycetota bacterium]